LPESGENVEFDVAGARTTVTLADALAIETALIARLRQSELAEREELIRAARDNRPSFEIGAARIGTWVLRVDRNRLVVSHRTVASGPGPIYRAEVSKEGESWIVKPVESGMIHPRR
jgi:hypothetical protein